MTQSISVAEAKNALREYAGARRRLANRLAGPGASVRAANHFFAAIPVPLGSVISAYWPIREEFDVRPLLRRLAVAGYVCALPVVDRKRHELVFRAWRPGARLLEGPFRISEPLDTAPVMTPTMLLVPLLAFDSDGYRLGYGGGYYDDALAKLRADGRLVCAVGIAYSEQQVEHVPHTETDERLDWIVTERSALPISSDIKVQRA